MFFKGEIPFVRLLIPLILGIGISWYRPDQVVYKLGFAALALSMIFFFTLLVSYKNHHVYRNKWFIGLLVHLIILIAAYNLTYLHAQKFNADHFANMPSEALIVTVSNEPQASGEILRFESRVEQSVSLKTIKKASGRLLVALKMDAKHPPVLKFGDRMIIPSKYTGVEPPYNPGEFNYKEYLATRQLYHQVFLSRQEIRIVGHDAGDQILSYAIGLRRQLVKKFYRYLPDKEAAALASTLILGYRANLSKEVVSAYSKTGTMHVLSVSGMHVGIIFVVLNFLIRPLRRFKHMRYASALLIIVLIWFYALITGFSPSVCRAAMMLTFVVLGKALHKNLNTYNLLAISAFFLLLYNPYYLLDVGFQLSYFAVLGLVYLHPKIYGLFYIKNKLLDSAWSYCALSCAAQLATFPLSIYYFHQFPLYFLLGNLVIVLPVALIMYAGIIFLFIPWPGVLAPLGWFLNKLIGFTDQILYYIEDLPMASIADIWISRIDYLMIYLIIGSVIFAITSRQKFPVYISLFFICLLTYLLTIRSIRQDRETQLIFYSLRKNSAIAYVRHRQAYLISDLLKDTKTITYSIMPALTSRGVLTVKKINSMASFANQDVNVRPGYMQLGEMRILKWNKRLNHTSPMAVRPITDIVLITGNPFITVKKIRDHVNFSTLLIDATNSDNRIREWQAEARNLKVPVFVLKKQPAFILNTKP